MQFALICRDAPGALDKRLANRPEHIDGLKAMKAEGSLIDGGAMLNDNGEMCGSVMLVEFESRAALDAYLESEVFAREGVWGDIEVVPFRRAQL